MHLLSQPHELFSGSCPTVNLISPADLQAPLLLLTPKAWHEVDAEGKFGRHLKLACPRQEASLAAHSRSFYSESLYFMTSECFLAQTPPIGDSFLLCSFVSVWVSYLVLNELAIIVIAP